MDIGEDSIRTSILRFNLIFGPHLATGVLYLAVRSFLLVSNQPKSSPLAFSFMGYNDEWRLIDDSVPGSAIAEP
jgi:hypothetical protein